MAKKLLKSGAAVELQLTGSRKMSMYDISVHVGGAPRRIDIPSGLVMFVNDKAKRDSRNINPTASRIFTGEGDIYGEVIVCEKNELENG